MTDIEPKLPDAYQQPQQVRPGCQHQLGCKCMPPYWLRASTPAEEAREKWLRDGMGKSDG
jgi:hypothetical protein